jgi:hypothetical protein
MANPSPPDKITSRRAQFFKLFFPTYIVAMLLCLRQWGSPNPWSRVDRFSGGYILLSLLWLLAGRQLLRTFQWSEETGAELSGAAYDPWTLRFTMILPILEVSVFLDYGHWRLMPALEQPGL